METERRMMVTRGCERGGYEESVFMGTELQLEKMKKVLEIVGGGGSNVNVLTATIDIKMVKMVNLCYVYFTTTKNV